ncbi:MAG: hypothetical protein JWR16_3564 [Nevskia sp.]|nr:hypothetical protein [Nevskia sp.]
MPSPADPLGPIPTTPPKIDPTLARHQERHGLSRLLFEMLLLVASVLLAFAVNDWSNARERQKLALRVLEDLQREISLNQHAIGDALSYHEQTGKSLRAAREQIAAGGAWDYPPEFEGLREILFQRAAFDSAMLSQTLPHLSVNTLAAVAALYTQQDQYTQNLHLYAAATLQSDNKDALRDLRLTENCLKQMARDERQLLPLMQTALTAVTAELQNPS